MNHIDYDYLEAYMLLVKACDAVKEMRMAAKDLHIYNSKFEKHSQPFDCVDRLMDNVSQLEERFDYIKRTWERDNINR